MTSTNLVCPHCGNPIVIEEVLKKQIEASLLANEREAARKEATLNLDRQMQEKLKLLEELNLKKEKELRASQEHELILRKKTNQLEDEKRAFALEKQRQLDSEREQIRSQTAKQLLLEHEQLDAQKDKKMADMLKIIDEMKRKAEQGSQQTQGEVVELALEETLRSAFPFDLIEPIGKGVNGADIKQTVKSPKGVSVGVILWESKQTKSFDQKWLGKLKSDVMAAKANIPALVTNHYTDPAWSGMAEQDGVWICSFSLVVPLAMLLRKAILDVGYQKAVGKNQGHKESLMYEYITGHEFRQHIQAMTDVFCEMQTQIQKERTVFEKQWKQREGQMQRLLSSTAGVYGSLQGRAGLLALPEIAGLELINTGL